MSNDSTAISLVGQIIEKAVSGNATLNISGSDELAKSYVLNNTYKNNDERVNSLINWESVKSFTAGFVTGLGGLVTLPIALPAGLVSTWIIQARLCAAIAKIYGHDIKEERVQTMVLLAILGGSGKEVLKEAGVQIGKEITWQTIKILTPKIVKEINKIIGYKLITRAGQKTLLSNLGKALPIVGGVIGGSIDATSCKTVGTAAKYLFKK